MPDDHVGWRTPRRVELAGVAAADLGTLHNLFQFYEYDFSEIEPAEVAADGRFHALDAVEFDHAYFIKADTDLAGFALVLRQASQVKAPEAVWWMKEFFVMRRYRRTSVGRDAVRLVIGRHPGTWEIAQTPGNAAAIAFWRGVLAEYRAEHLTFDDPQWGRRPLQRFSTVEAGGR